MNRSPVRVRWRQYPPALALLLVALCASAHDTWFESRGPRTAGDLFMALGTGSVFPAFDSAVGPEHLQRRGCREGGVSVVFSPVAQASASLLLKARVRRTAPASCWAQLVPSEIELQPGLVPIYLAEARPPASVREAWSAMEADRKSTRLNSSHT